VQEIGAELLLNKRGARAGRKTNLEYLTCEDAHRMRPVWTPLAHRFEESLKMMFRCRKGLARLLLTYRDNGLSELDLGERGRSPLRHVSRAHKGADHHKLGGGIITVPRLFGFDVAVTNKCTGNE